MIQMCSNLILRNLGRQTGASVYSVPEYRQFSVRDDRKSFIDAPVAYCVQNLQR